MQNVTITTNSARGAYDRVRNSLAANGNDPALFQIQPMTLRLERTISSRTSYTFDLKQQNTADSPSEIKLNQNDAFYLTHAGLCLAKTVQGETPGLPLGNAILYTWPYATIFAGTDEAGALEAFYNGLFTLTTKPVERIKDLYTTHFRFAPLLYNDASAEVPWGADDHRRGLYPLTVETIIDGSEDNQATITVPANSDISAAVVDDETNTLVLLLHGFAVLNGARKIGKFL